MYPRDEREGHDVEPYHSDRPKDLGGRRGPGGDRGARVHLLGYSGIYNIAATDSHLGIVLDTTQMRSMEERGDKAPDPPPARMAERYSFRELFWIPKHGLKTVGMPAFGPAHSDEEIWGTVASWNGFRR